MKHFFVMMILVGAFAAIPMSFVSAQDTCECTYTFASNQDAEKIDLCGSAVSQKYLVGTDQASTIAIFKTQDIDESLSSLDNNQQGCQAATNSPITISGFMYVDETHKKDVTKQWCDERKTAKTEQLSVDNKYYAAQVVCAYQQASTSGTVSTGQSLSAPQRVQIKNPLTTNVSIAEFIGSLIQIIISIIGALLFAAYVFAGFLFLTAAGNASRIQLGMKTMLYSTIGFFVVFGSYAIIQLFFSAV
jgi:hypothetical protein